MVLVECCGCCCDFGVTRLKRVVFYDYDEIG
ncbi:MAG: bifunctional isocitrate dehydrogenase kinase/phosphatase, partial [Cyanothece sp. SIO1E1]|nr:bifunctional isocitrate dehydrogenase kinase/phosphatase [Cyanothece sp. SIO1E1]